MKSLCAAVVLAASALAENTGVPEVSQQFAQQQHQQPEYSYAPRQDQYGDVVSHGKWVTMEDNYNPYGQPARNPWG